MNVKFNNCISTDIYEENSCLFLENSLVSNIKIKELTNGYNLLKLSDLQGITKSSVNTCSSCLFFVLYSSDCEFISKNGHFNKKFSIWNITDLKGSKCKLFLLGETSVLLKNEQIGYLYLVFTPSIIDLEKTKFAKHLSISKIEQIIKIGKVRDFSICKGINKNGSSCVNPINISLESFCKYHLPSKKKQDYLNVNDLIPGNIISLSKNIQNLQNDFNEQNDNKKIPYRRIPNNEIRTNKINFCYNKNTNNQVNLSFEDQLNAKLNIELIKFNKIITQAIKDNNKSEILSLLRELSKLDTSKMTLSMIIESEIIESLANLELNINEIDIAIFAVRIRHKFCNSKNFWPKIELSLEEKKHELKISYKNMQKTICKDIYKDISEKENILIDKIKDKGAEIAIIENILKKKRKKIDNSSCMNNEDQSTLNKINDIISLETICDEDIKKLENANIRKRLQELEKADKIEQYKHEVNSVYINNAIKCSKCNIWTEGLVNKICQKEHPEEIIYNQKALKKAWLCKSCNSYLYSINNYVNPYCPSCKENTTCNLMKRSIYRLKRDPNMGESLKIRDEESKGNLFLRSIDNV